MEAQPSGEITEYTEFSSMYTRSPMAIAKAPPEPPSPVIAIDNRHGQARHFAQVEGNRFGLAAFLRVHSRISTRSIHEDHYRPPKFRSELHRAQRLAIAFRLRLSEISGERCFMSRPFWLPTIMTGLP